MADSNTNNREFCKECHSELRSGNLFCVSCGSANHPPMIAIDREQFKDQFADRAHKVGAFIGESARWVRDTGRRHPALTAFVSIVGIIILFNVSGAVSYLPLIGGFLYVMSLLAIVPFLLALITPALEWQKKHAQLQEERRAREALHIERVEEERRREEEELRQRQQAYQEWFVSLSPAEQQVELTKQMMIRQDQQMQQMMAQQNNFHKEQQNADNWRTAAILFGIMNNNNNHRR